MQFWEQSCSWDRITTTLFHGRSASCAVLLIKGQVSSLYLNFIFIICHVFSLVGVLQFNFFVLLSAVVPRKGVGNSNLSGGRSSSVWEPSTAPSLVEIHDPFNVMSSNSCAPRDLALAKGSCRDWDLMRISSPTSSHNLGRAGLHLQSLQPIDLYLG